MRISIIKHLSKSDADFRKVLAGAVTLSDYFSKPEFKNSKDGFMRLYEQTFGNRPPESMYSNESVAAAWITKLRYNEQLTDSQFINYINRSEGIFNGSVNQYNLTATTAVDNDLCAIMWGIEALNGVQSFDRGTTRVRFPPGVAPKIVQALEEAQAVPRASTHAKCTRLVDCGLGKDVQDERVRLYTPRGMGTFLVLPTSRDGVGHSAKNGSAGVSSSLESYKDYDLLLKRENYGLNDTALHSRVHIKMGFINRLTDNVGYEIGKKLIEKKTFLASMAEKEFGKFKHVHRKEHLSELKGQSLSLLNIFAAGQKEGLFSDFKTQWVIRIKIPPWEKKIIAADSNSREGLGEFLAQIAENEAILQASNAGDLNKIQGLLMQVKAEKMAPFQRCREGNEVLVNCETGKAQLIAALAKDSNNTPVNRKKLVEMGIASDVDPTKHVSVAPASKFKRQYAQLKLDTNPPEDDPTHTVKPT